MSRYENQPIEIEPERYELLAEPTYRFELERREFLRVLGAGLLVTAVLPGQGWGQQRDRSSSRSRAAAGPDGRLHVSADGVVTVLTGKVEVGQDIRTALTLGVAEELRVAPANIRLIMGDTELVPDDGPTYGSRTVPRTFPVVRQAAAALREHFLDLAAAQWGVERAELSADDGKVHDSQRRRALTYGELAQSKRAPQKIGQVALTPAEQWKVAGRATHKINGEEFVTGRHLYPCDIRREGMLYGKVLRPPSAGAKLVGVDIARAAAPAGVTVVHDGDFVGVAAPTRNLAAKAIQAIDASWSAASQPNDRTIYDHLKSRPPSPGGGGLQQDNFVRPVEKGVLGDALANAAHKQEATYTIAYIAHVPLEARSAVAEWDDGKLTVWTGTQIPFNVRRDVADALRLSPGRVRVVMPDTGSAYGGKHRVDAAVEAAKLAVKVGRPVQVFWSREEEFNWAYLRPAGVIDVRAGAAQDGALVAWEFTNYNSGTSALNCPWYDIPNVKTGYQPSASPFRQGSYRALASTANNFARESHLDDLARQARIDPLAFRLKNLKDERLKAVVTKTAEKFGWERAKSSATRGYGIACGYEKGGYVACCAEVEVNPASGAARVARLTQGFECGAIVDPAHLKSQVVGCMIQGLGGALFEEVRFENGKILNNKFSGYRLPRFSDVPPIDVVLLDRKDLPPAGGGETPIIAVAPAIRNAVLAATGKALRSLPLRIDDVKS